MKTWEPEGMRATDTVSVDRFIQGMQRRERWRLALLSLFAFNAVAAAAFSLHVWWTRDLAAGFLAPALLVEVISVCLLALLWHRTNQRRRFGRASTATNREFIAATAAETRRAIREQRLLMGVTAAVLTPLFAWSVWTQVGAGRMDGGDALSIAGLYVVCLSVVLGTAWSRLRSRLYPRLRHLAGLEADLHS